MKHGVVHRTVGAPGSGKSERAKARFEELLRPALEQARPGAQTGGLPAALWCAQRTTADATRDELVRRLGRATHNVPAMTPQSFAHSLVTDFSRNAGRKPPRLLSGADHDALLAQSLDITQHAATATWPQQLHEAIACDGFRDELRTLALVADEFGISPTSLAELGREHDRREWVAAAEVFAEVERAKAWTEPAFNHAALQREAAEQLRVRGLPVQWSQLHTVIVDDAQELGPSAVAVLRELVGLGVCLELYGDPDCATGGFRGASPGLWLQPFTDKAEAAPELLTTVWRQGGDLRACATAVADHIGVRGAARHRHAKGAGQGRITAVELPTPAAELAYVAGQLTTAHVGGVPWNQLGVIVRSAGRLTEIEKALQSHGVPTGQPPRRRPLGDESAVRLLRAACLLGLGQDVPSPYVWDLLHSDAVGLDPLYDDELVTVLAGDVPPHEFDLGRAVRDAAPDLDTVSLPITWALKRLDIIMQAANRPDADNDALHSLWSVWSACELAEKWKKQALRGGRVGARADDDLDATMALFDACERFVRRHEGGSLTAFWREVDQLHMAADTLAAQTHTADTVRLLTPSLAAGLTLHTVAIVGMEEGLWPNPAQRDSLLGAFDLGGLVTGEKTGAVDKRREVMNDELRMLYVALTRATDKVIVTTVDDDAVSGSVFFEVVSAFATEDDVPRDEFIDKPFGAAYTVARLRRDVQRHLGAGDRAAAAPFAAALASLANADVRAADPEQWNLPISIMPWSPLAGDEKPRLSPSAVEATITCPLRWFLGTRGFEGDFGLSAEFGTLVHDIAAEVPGGDLPTMLSALEERWPALHLPPTWGMARERLRVEEMLSKWAPRAASRADQVFGVERPLLAEFDEAIVSGRADRIEEIAPGRLRVVDIKTGGSAVRLDDALVHDQLGVYQLMVDSGAAGEEYESAGAELVYVGTPSKKAAIREQPPLEPVDGEEPWPRRRVRQAAAIASGSSFEARPGKHCSHCSFAAGCPTTMSRSTEQHFVAAGTPAADQNGKADPCLN